ncbi:MAG: hypothetical protein ACYC8T_26560 [Myxococcaceae bacterium]
MLALFKQIVTLEKLPPPPPAPAAPRRVRRAARWIFSIDELPVDEADPPKKAERGIFRALFAVETLPLDTPAPPRRTNPYLRWLLGLERLDEKPAADDRSPRG